MQLHVSPGARARHRVLALAFTLGLTLAPVAFGAEDARYQIHLLTGTLTPPAGVPSETLTALAAQAAVAAAQSPDKAGQPMVHVLVQLREVPSAAARKEMAREGLELQEYATGNAWVAAMHADRAAAVARRADVRWLTGWDAAKKLHPRVRAAGFGPWAKDAAHPGWVMTFVQLHHDVSLARGEAIARAVGGRALPPVEGLHGMTVWVPQERVAELARFEDVLWVDEGPMPLSPTNDGIRAQMKINTVAAAPYSLNGNGTRLFVFDGGTVQVDHPTFSGIFGSNRATLIDQSPLSDHATHVAGTAAGNGSGSPGLRGKGMAPSALIYSAGYQQMQSPSGDFFWDNAGDIEADYALAANTYNVDLGTNSLGSKIAFYDTAHCDREGDYDVSASLIDGIVRGDNPAVGRPVLMTWAAGNERIGGCGGNYATTNPPACAKNPIHVGAIESDGSAMTEFSSWGPCDDGRLKPLVVAPGCETGAVTGERGIFSSIPYDAYSAFLNLQPVCGTSMSTPAVAGTLALFLQDWRAHGFGGANDRPLPALAKAMLIHSAKDLGPVGPDFIYGYGAVDAKALIDLLRADDGVLGNGNGPQWGTGSVAQGEVHTYSITVPSGAAQIKASLAWDDPAAAAFVAKALVNDLTVELIAPNGTVYKSWNLSAASPWMPATQGGNTVDNQEQALVANPAAGTWTVRVTGTNVPQGPQAFGLTYSVDPASLVSCSTLRSFDFEAGAPGMSFDGNIDSAPLALGKALDLGNADWASFDVTLPANASRAELSYSWLMTTFKEGPFGADKLMVSVNDPVNPITLAVVDLRTAGWIQNKWMSEPHIDLSPWAGKTLNIRFDATTADAGFLLTDHFLDNIKVTSCQPLVIFPPSSLTATSNGSYDGTISESFPFSHLGGIVYNPTGAGTIQVGNGVNGQLLGFLSFDTSAIPDGATITGAKLRLHVYGFSGPNPFLSNGSLLADIKTGSFGNDPALTSSDFQATATATAVAALSPALNYGDWSESAVSTQGLAAINKTGLTQIRLRFETASDSNPNPTVLHYDTGDSTMSYRPQLIITYSN